MMRMQLKPNPWSCSVASMAMALSITTEQLIMEVGHDGSEIIFPDLPEPMCRRGFHSQELIHVARCRGWAVTAVELNPCTSPTNGSGVLYPVQIRNNVERFANAVYSTMGILEGRCKKCRHAVHYDHGVIYDPGGRMYEYSMESCELYGFYGNRVLILESVI